MHVVNNNLNRAMYCYRIVLNLSQGLFCVVALFFILRYSRALIIIYLFIYFGQLVSNTPDMKE